VAKLSAWLDSRGLGAGGICRARIEEFLSDLAARPGRAPTLVTMRPPLAWLGRLGLAKEDPLPAPGPLDALMGRYRHWMVTDRQLAARTIRRYEQGARLFLKSQARQGGNPAGAGGLSEQAVTAFLLANRRRGGCRPSRCRAGWRSCGRCFASCICR
jgi:hypothetical protein